MSSMRNRPPFRSELNYLVTATSIVKLWRCGGYPPDRLSGRNSRSGIEPQKTGALMAPVFVPVRAKRDRAGNLLFENFADGRCAFRADGVFIGSQAIQDPALTHLDIRAKVHDVVLALGRHVIKG